MAPDKLQLNDPRVEHRQARVGGRTYHYLHGRPQDTEPAATILLLHGFPDLARGWRYQIPFLLSLGLEVLAPDLLGYGQTDSPDSLAAFSMKSMSDDMAALVRQHLGQNAGGSSTGSSGPQILVAGHDWGGALAWRLALWHPALVRAVISVCTPYTAPLPVYLSTAAVVARVPNFAYQLQFDNEGGGGGGSGDGTTTNSRPLEDEFGADEARLRQFLTALHGGRGPQGEPGFRPDRGVVFENLGTLQPSPLLAGEELEFYGREYARHGLRGPLRWYRTRKVNYEEEMSLLGGGTGAPPRLEMPALMISATKDAVLSPAMSAGMEKHFAQLSRGSVEANHWAPLEAPEEVNRVIGDFLRPLIERGEKASL